MHRPASWRRLYGKLAKYQVPGSSYFGTSHRRIGEKIRRKIRNPLLSESNTEYSWFGKRVGRSLTTSLLTRRSRRKGQKSSNDRPESFFVIFLETTCIDIRLFLGNCKQVSSHSANSSRHERPFSGECKQPMRGIPRLLRLLVPRRADPSVSTSRLHGTTCQCGLSLCVLVAVVV